MRLLLALLTLVATAAVAQAQDMRLREGAGLACDTAAQVARVIELDENNYAVAVGKVNSEYGPGACIITRMMFVEGAEVLQYRKNGFVFSIKELTVYGAMTRAGMVRTARPYHWFTLHRLPGQDT